NADALFPFDKSDASDINQQGIVSLDNLAMKLNSFEQLNSIRVIGYTDRLGSPDYNNILSKKRAETIRNYLIAKGVPAGKIIAVGMGESQPVKECNYDEKNRTALINCLQPNQRVEVDVDGTIRISDE
ncbi:OmpA family protein, partial [Escherichia coli]|uniref:OmpA family protein n=1 Tax=Escherichia coli TaxID=562 RepID=UPI001BD51B08